MCKVLHILGQPIWLCLINVEKIIIDQFYLFTSICISSINSCILHYLVLHSFMFEKTSLNTYGISKLITGMEYSCDKTSYIGFCHGSKKNQCKRLYHLSFLWRWCNQPSLAGGTILTNSTVCVSGCSQKSTSRFDLWPWEDKNLKMKIVHRILHK